MDENEDKISVLLVRPGEYPIRIRIENTLERMQEMVGGNIETLYFDDGAVLVCNEEGKLNGLPLNRALVQNAQLKDVIAGDFFIAYAPPGSEEFSDLPQELEDKYEQKFRYPERFFNGRNGVFVKQYAPELNQKEVGNER